MGKTLLSAVVVLMSAASMVYPQVPGTPTMRSAVALGPISAQVNWNPTPPLNERGFLIRNHLGAICGNSDAGTHSFVVTNLEPETNTRFTVQAYAEVGDSGFLYSGLSGWSNWIKTDSSTMRVPERIVPCNGSLNLSADSLAFRWKSVPSGYGYRLQILCDDDVVVDWQRIGDTAMTVCRALASGREYRWRVQSMDQWNVPSRWSAPWTFSTSGIASAGAEGSPVPFDLRQNYPNPFNPVTTIEYNLPVRERVRIEVYSGVGQRVAILADGVLEAGLHTERLDGRNLASGVYLIRMVAGDLVHVRKCILLR